VAKVDGKIDLVVLWDVEDVLFVLHVHGNEFIANFRCMLGVVHEAELLGLDVNFKDWVAFKSNAFTFNFLSPTVLVKTLSEEDNVGQYSLVVILVDAVAHPIQI
jgi:CRISPR/Cas system endoribonuclease Cas6 (RAMP superfamily)